MFAVAGLAAMRLPPKTALRNRSLVEIVDFDPSLAHHFKELNLEWLADFGVEPLDDIILGNPGENIVAAGGAILFARRAEEIVGTCALIPVFGHPGHFELGKMAVASAHRATGIGRQLLARALQRFKALGGVDLHLETNSRLSAAIHLYESVGFEQIVRPGGPSMYTRADVYMVYAMAKQTGEHLC